MAETLRLLSPAKINLRLEILRKREDGYHELRTIFQKISLFDTLRFSLTQEKGILITADHPGLPVGRKNLVYLAIRSVLKRGSYRGGVRVEIRKRIPLGAGLGGGSSNAAAAMKALNLLLGMGLSRNELMEMGVKIGADVPFFFLDGAAMGTGIGERLRRIELPKLWFVLIYPNVEVSTRWTYQNFVLTKKRFRLNIHKLLKTPEGISCRLRNDLEGIVSSKYPQIEVMKKNLCSAGALGALMTGSGPTVFGVFPDEGSASAGYRKVKNMVRPKGWTVLKAHSIP
jgi:4-diphosphocytidyl-2-C-methyl-D-erythritol kinase